MRRVAIGGAAILLLAASPASAQSMDHAMHGMTMPGMQRPMPAHKPTRKTGAKAAPAASHKRAARAAAADPHAGRVGAATPTMNMGGMEMRDLAPSADAPDPHAGHDMAGMAGMTGMAATADRPAAGTDLPPGNAPAPAAQQGYLADRLWGADVMAASRRADLRREHGGMTYRQLLFNVAEYRATRGQDGYRWDGEAWIGGDIDRLVVRSEGEGRFRRAPDRVEVQALYSRAVDPYWNLQAGVRYDVTPDPSRTYATVGIEGLAPYWFDVEGALFLSDKGDLRARIEAWYDQRLTRSFVLQPRIEANASAQAMRAIGVGAGLTDVEIGLRLRYERSRRIAPYVGVSWERRFGATASLRTARDDDTGGVALVAGVRTRF